MQVKKQQLELDMEQQTGSKLGKEYIKAVYCHPAYLTYMQSKYMMRDAGLEEAQADIFLELLCFLHDSTDVANLISGSSAS